MNDSPRIEAAAARPLRWPAVPLALLGGLALLMRFTQHGLAPFVLDEPQFLDAARAERVQGWLSASPLVGNQGLHYGPAFIWIETVLQTLFGPRPEVVLWYQAVLLTFAHLALAWALARAFKGGVLLFAIVLGVLAISPCSFFYARQAWDNPLLNAGTALSVALLAREGTLNFVRAALLGLLLGLSAATHLMVTPFIAVVGVVLLWEGRKQLLPTLARLSVAAGVALGILFPYLRYLQALPKVQLPPSPSFRWELLGILLSEPFRFYTAMRAQYFFDADWPAFHGSLPLAGALAPGNVMAGVFMLLTLVGLVAAVRSETGAARRLALMGLLGWPGYALFCAWRNVELHPHYQNPAVWVLPLGVACVFSLLRRRAPRWALGVYSGLAGLLFLVQVPFLGHWMLYVSENRGTRGIHYSSPLEDQEAAVRRICAAPTSRVLVENFTAIFPQSLDYLRSVEPTCNGKEVRYCRGACPTIPDISVVRLAYEPNSAQVK